MTTRIVQLISRYIAVALTAVAAWLSGAAETASPPPQVAPLSDAMATAIAAVVLFLIDLVIHRLHAGGVLKPADRNLALLLPVVIAPLLLTGCMAAGPLSPLQQTVIGRETYTATLNGLSVYRQTGLIGDAATLEIEHFRGQAAVALDLMEQAALNGDGVGWSDAVSAFNAAMDELIARRLRLQKGNADDRTRTPGADARDGRGDAVPDDAGRATATRGPRADARGSCPGEGAAGRRGEALAGAAAPAPAPGSCSDWRRLTRRSRLCTTPDHKARQSATCFALRAGAPALNH